MQLKNISKKYIEELVPDAIYKRGNSYYMNGMVESLVYDPDKNEIQADVIGSQSNIYNVEIKEKSKGIDHSCDCPYEGYTCKHVIAVLLEFMDNKEKYMREAFKSKELMVSLKQELNKISAEKLAGMIMNYAERHSDIKMELSIMFHRKKQKPWGKLERIFKKHVPVLRQGMKVLYHCFKN
jgi:uncharacterized Zn finger protein